MQTGESFLPFYMRKDRFKYIIPRGDEHVPLGKINIAEISTKLFNYIAKRQKREKEKRLPGVNEYFFSAQEECSQGSCRQ